jgi:hypothetical protein
MPDAEPPLLDSEQAAFIVSGISISAASGRSGALPSLARATGCRLSDDRRTLSLLVGATASAGLLDDVRRSGMIAVVFSRPADHRTLQIKGTDARIVPTEAGDDLLAAHYVDTFVASLDALGYPGPVIRAFMTCDAEDLVVVRFTPMAIFTQTPGPEAGTALRARA